MQAKPLRNDENATFCLQLEVRASFDLPELYKIIEREKGTLQFFYQKETVQEIRWIISLRKIFYLLWEKSM